MPVNRRPDGSYQVTIGYGGRTHRKSSRHWSHADAKEYERKWLAQIALAASGRQPERLIEDALATWLETHVPTLRSARQTRNHVRALLPYIAGRKLAEAGSVWADIKRDMHGKAPATINHKGRILRQVSRMAWQELGWIDRPAVIKLLAETPRERFLTREEVMALAEACQNDKARDYVLLASYTGIRRGHLLRLTSHDVQGRFLRLDRSGKTQRLQMIPLHPSVQAIAERLPLGIGDRQLKEAWTLARQATGIDCRWHDLRHTCASWLVQAGVPIRTVADILGHSTITLTQRYAHLAPAHLAEAIDRIA